MKFVIRRTSAAYKEQPCEEAYKGTYVCHTGETFETWYVDLTPEELISFCKKYESVIVSYEKRGFAEKTFVLEIYDDWRE